MPNRSPAPPQEVIDNGAAGLGTTRPAHSPARCPTLSIRSTYANHAEPYAGIAVSCGPQHVHRASFELPNPQQHRDEAMTTSVDEAFV